MSNVLIVVKLLDQIALPDSLPASILVGDDYFDAQALRLAGWQSGQIKNGESLFWAFFEAFNQLARNRPLACLYGLSDKVAYGKRVGFQHNLLNFFAFEYTVDPSNLPISLKELTSITQHPAVAYWWYEDKMSTLIPPHESTFLPSRVSGRKSGPGGSACVAHNEYYTTLAMGSFPYRGEGIAIMESEDFGHVPRHPYLATLRYHLLAGGGGSASNRSHFYASLGILFAQKPAGSRFENIVGLAPNATLFIQRFNTALPIEQLFATFADNFRERRRISDALITDSATILMINRAVSLPIASTSSGRTQQFIFPIEVMPDIRALFIECAAHNLIVVQPAAWQSGRYSPNLSNALALLATYSSPATYTDFSLPFTLRGVAILGSASLLISAVDSRGDVQARNNFGTPVDLHLWGQCVRSIDYHPPGRGILAFQRFTDASAATAIGAGMVAALCSAAHAHNKPLPSLAAIKAVLTPHFQSGATRFNPITLADLWDELSARLT